MRKIQILVVDDSVVVRKVVSEILSSDPNIEVAATAANGKIALQRMAQHKVDLVILDVEMPEMDGLQTLTEIRKTFLTLPVIMFSSLTERGAQVTIEALALGASDYVTKPTGTGNIAASMAFLRNEMLPKVRILCRKLFPDAAKPIIVPMQPANTALSAGLQGKTEKPKIEVLGIGVSTGGPNVLGATLPHLPKDFPVPVLVVQHMPPVFTRFLAERLNLKCQLQVKEAVAGTVITPGCIWIAPGDFHMVVARSDGRYRIETIQTPPENSCRPAVDVLFRSLAQVYGKHTLATVLTGMGQDGLRGSQAIHESGGEIYVQDEQSSVVWGMPGAIAQAGIAEKILPLELVAGEWIRRVGQGR
jgi:two-component system chemotaxis response regulator CheB